MTPTCPDLYTGCPQKSGTLDFRYFDIKKYSIYICISSEKTLSSEKNDTKLIWFGSVVLILQPFLETQIEAFAIFGFLWHHLTILLPFHLIT